MNDIFGPGSNPENRVFTDYDLLAKKVDACRQLGFRVVLTSGTFDLFHVGHARYLERAKGILGCPDQTVLVVGVDSDDKVRARKKRNPIVAEDERVEIVCHQRSADIVFRKPVEAEPWKLIRIVRPDVLIVSETTKEHVHTESVGTDVENADLASLCGEVRKLPAQATTSTTARIRLLLINYSSQAREKVQSFYEDMMRFFDQIEGGHRGS